MTRDQRAASQWVWYPRCLKLKSFTYRARAALEDHLSLVSLMSQPGNESWSCLASVPALIMELAWRPVDKVIYLLHEQEGLRHIMAGPKLAFLSCFTLYFTLARVILLGQEIDFKSPFLLLTAPWNPPSLGPLSSLSLWKAHFSVPSFSTPSTHTHKHTHTQLFPMMGILFFPNSI